MTEKQDFALDDEEIRREIVAARWVRAALLLGVAVALAWPA